MIDGFNCENCNGPFFSFGFIDTCSTSLTNGRFRGAATLVGGLLVNGGTIDIRDLEISAVKQFAPMPGLEVAHLALNLIERSTLQGAKFSEFEEGQVGILILANSTDITVKDVEVDALVGERGLIIDNCRGVLIQNLRVNSRNTTTLLQSIQSADITQTNFTISGFYPKQLVLLYDVSNFTIKSTKINAPFYSSTIFQISMSEVTLHDTDFSYSFAMSLFTYTFKSKITAYNMKIIGFSGVVGRFVQSELFFIGIEVAGGDKVLTDIDLMDSSLNFENFRFSAVKTQSFLLKSSGSQVTLRSGVFGDLNTSEDSLFDINEGSLTMTDVEVSGLRCKFMRVYSAKVVLSDVKVMDIDISGQLSFSAESQSPIYLEDSDIQLNRVSAQNLKGVRGGFLGVKGNKTGPVVILHSTFENCSAEDGGALYLLQAQTIIEASMFVGNAAVTGGAVAHLCEVADCRITIVNSQFIYNTASAGGGLYWSNQFPVINNTLFANNTAPFGPDIASVGVRLSKLNEDMSISTQTQTEAAGQSFQSQLLFGLLDSYGQLVLSDSSSFVYLSANDSSQIVGSDTAIAKEGVFNYSMIRILKEPDTQALLTATHSFYTPGDTALQFNFELTLRPCIIGEVTAETQCQVCRSPTYSLHPSEAKCIQCPSSATCLGGSFLELDEGYWRLDNTTDDIYECYSESSCLGGAHSQCARGYYSRLCMSCNEGWERVGRFQCTECLLYRGIVNSLISVALWIVFLIVIKELVSGRRPFVFELFKELMELLQTFSILSTFKGYNSTFLTSASQYLDQIPSLGLFWLSSACWVRVDGLPSVYIRALIFSVSPCVLCLASKAVHMCYKHCKKSLQSLEERLVAVNIGYFFIINPHIIRHSLDLVVCQRMEHGSLFLIADPSQECWTELHSSLVYFFAVPSLVIWGLVVPGIFFVVMFKSCISKSAAQLKYFKYCLFGLKAQFFWWELATFLRKLLLVTTASLMLQYSYETQLLTGTFVLLIGVSSNYVLSPYFRNTMNYFESCYLSVASAFMIIFFSFAKSSKDSSNGGMLVMFSVLGSVAIVIVTFGYLIYSMSYRVRRRLKVCEMPTSNLNQSSLILPPPPPSPSENCPETSDKIQVP